MIAIVDYGVGNIRSVERALVHVGAEARLTADVDELERSDGIVLPGVGAFAPALAAHSCETNLLGSSVPFGTAQLFRATDVERNAGQRTG